MSQRHTTKYSWLRGAPIPHHQYGGTLEDAGQIIGKSGDHGIDGVIKEDRLGLDIIQYTSKKMERYCCNLLLGLIFLVHRHSADI